MGDPAVVKHPLPFGTTDFATYQVWLACHLTERGMERLNGLEVFYDSHSSSGCRQKDRTMDDVRISLQWTTT